MAQYHSQITQAGARIVGISVDPPERNAAMVDKLDLPFPLLADPEGEQAIKPYELWHDGQPFGKPAVVVVRPDGTEALRQVGEDFADRLPEDELRTAITELDLPATGQDPPTPGNPNAGENAVALPWLSAYLMGSKTSAIALAGRVPEAREPARKMRHSIDHFIEAVNTRTSG